MSSSELQREAASANVRCEEVEHQKKAKLLLKTQEIELQSKKSQFKLDLVDREKASRSNYRRSKKCRRRFQNQWVLSEHVEIVSSSSGQPRKY